MRETATVRNAVLLLGLVALAFAGQGVRGIWDPDEGRYAVVALEMVRSGDWMTPRLNPETPHFTKPPLTYWTIGASMAAFGRSELAVRLPNASAFAWTVLLLASMGRRLVPARPALPAIVYATSLLPFVGSCFVTSDTLLALWTTLALWGFILLWIEGRSSGAFWMWIGSGFAFLTKGPPGLLPLAPIALFVAIRRPFPWRRLAPATGLLAFAVLAVGWYGFEAMQRPDLLPYLLRNEVVDRIATPMHHRNSGPWGWWIYLPTAALGVFPWAMILPFQRRRDATQATGFLVLSIAVPLAVFCVASSRLPLYLLPLAAPAALLIATLLPENLLDRRSARIALGAWVLALLGLRVGAGFFPNGRDPRPMADWIVSALGTRPSEVVFVGTPGRHGLALYLDCVVEEAALSGDGVGSTDYRPVKELVLHEVSENEPGRAAFVVAPSVAPAFEALLRSAGDEPVLLSSWHELRLYGVRRGAPPLAR